MSSSRTIQRRLNDHRDTDAAVAAATEQAAQALHAHLAPFLEDGESFTEEHAALLVRLARRRYAQAAEDLRVADQKHAEEKGEDKTARTERDLTLEEASALLVQLKATVRTKYGADFLASMPLESGTVRRGDDLLQQYERLVGWLEDAGKRFPTSQSTFDDGLSKAQVLEVVQPMQQRLQSALKGVATETRETGHALDQKNRALATFDASRTATKALLRGILQAAGLSDTAARL